MENTPCLSLAWQVPFTTGPYSARPFSPLSRFLKRLIDQPMQTDFSLYNLDGFILLGRQQTSGQAVFQCQNPTKIENFQILCFNTLVLQFPCL